MTFIRLTLLATLLAMTPPAPALAQSPAESQKLIKPLSAKDEKRWVDTFKAYKTADGATILHVLQFVEKLRPRQFKFSFDDSIGYSTTTGMPTTVGVSFYLGMKRLDGDQFGMGADVSVEGNQISLRFRDATGSAHEALLRGRDAFLTFVDQEYQSACIDGQTKRRMC